jgi:hypothetical protein
VQLAAAQESVDSLSHDRDTLRLALDTAQRERDDALRRAEEREAAALADAVHKDALVRQGSSSLPSLHLSLSPSLHLSLSPSLHLMMQPCGFIAAATAV